MIKTRAKLAALWMAVAILTLVAGCTQPTPPPQPTPTNQAQVYLRLAQQRLAENRLLEATAAFRQALDLAREPRLRDQARLGLAQALHADGRDEEALQELKALPSMGVDPELAVRAAFLAAQLEQAQDQHAQAAGRLRGLLTRPPRPLAVSEQTHALEMLSQSLTAQKQYRGAVDALLNVAAITADSSPEMAQRVYQVASNLGSAEIEDLLSQPRAPSLNVALLAAQAQAYLREGRLDQARQTLDGLRTQGDTQALGDTTQELRQELTQAGEVTPAAVGALLPLSGGYAKFGERALAAIQLGLGLFDSGTNLTLYIGDSQGEAEPAAQQVRRLVQENKVMAIIGPMGARPALAAARQAQELGVPLISLSQVRGITQAGDFVFQNALDPSEQVDALLEEAHTVRGLDKYAIMAPDNPYGHGFAQVFREAAEAKGATVVREIFYNPDQVDYSADVKRLAKLPPGNYRPGLPESPKPVVNFQALFMPDTAQRVALLAPQLAYHDINGVLLLGTNLWHDRLLLADGGRYLSQAMFPDEYDPDLEGQLQRRFTQEFRQAMDSDATSLEIHAYDAAVLVKTLLSRPAPPRNRAAFREALTQLRDVPGVSGMMSVDEQRRVRRKLILFGVAGGRFKPLDMPQGQQPPQPAGQTDAQPTNTQGYTTSMGIEITPPSPPLYGGTETEGLDKYQERTAPAGEVLR